jgi:hypothetical protein
MYWEYCVEDTAISTFLVKRFQVEGRYFLVTCHLELYELGPGGEHIFRQIHEIHTLWPKHHKGSSQPVLCGPRWPKIQYTRTRLGQKLSAMCTCQDTYAYTRTKHQPTPLPGEKLCTSTWTWLALFLPHMRDTHTYLQMLGSTVQHTGRKPYFFWDQCERLGRSLLPQAVHKI